MALTTLCAAPLSVAAFHHFSFADGSAGAIKDIKEAMSCSELLNGVPVIGIILAVWRPSSAAAIPQKVLRDFKKCCKQEFHVR